MKIEDLFNIEYPPTLVFSQQIKDPNGINFVSSSGKNNGIVGRIKYNPKNKLYEAGSITVPLKGSVLIAFVQPEKFYVAHQIAVLTPKVEMPLKNKIFYCLCLRKNAYKYNYGRQADKTLKEIELPDKIPDWVAHTEVPEINDVSAPLLDSNVIRLEDRKWRPFRYDTLFDIKKGKRITNISMKLGRTPCIRPIKSNNGVYKFIDIKPNHSENTITVNYNGSVGEAFYQPKPYFALDDVNVLYPKFKLNPFIAMFLITLIKKEKYRFNYGRKWKLERMNESIIKLPVDENNEPDWQFIEDYIKSLPYSSSIN